MWLRKQARELNTVPASLSANDTVRISLRENDIPGASCEVDNCCEPAVYRLPAPELELSGRSIRAWFGTCMQHTIVLLEGQLEVQRQCRA